MLNRTEGALMELSAGSNETSPQVTVDVFRERKVSDECQHATQV
jgi:hypothetical protein